MKKSIDMLLNEVGHLSLYKSHLKLAKLELYRGQPPLLEILFEKDGITQKEILEQLRVTKATISKTISRMVAKEFLIIKKDPNDKRITRVFLTEKGKNLKADLEEIKLEMANTILIGFSEEEKKDFEKLLKKVRKNLL